MTPALHPVLPKHNVFGAPAGRYLSVAHCWVALLDPLTPGTHTIEITGNFDGSVTTIVRHAGPLAAPARKGESPECFALWGFRCD